MSANDQEHLKIFAGRAGRHLAEAMCEHLSLPLGQASSTTFPDGEIMVKVEDYPSEEHELATLPRVRGDEIVNALLHHCKGQLSGINGVARPGIVHRIDKDTSGLMVAAKSDLAHRGLAALFKAHDIDRHYLAIVDGVPMPLSGRIEGAVGRASGDRKKMTVVSVGQGKHAVTHYAVREVLDQAALVDCTLETGRTHQVRVHMAHIGHPLIGDPLYGRRQKKSVATVRKAFSRQALHAAVLGFTHPITAEKLRFESPIPADMQELFRALRV